VPGDFCDFVRLDDPEKGSVPFIPYVVRMLPDYVPDVAAANAAIKSKRKAKQVFFLRLNPDGETYGIFTELSIMNINRQNAGEERLTYRADGRERAPFGLNEEADSVLQHIESLAAKMIQQPR
jgi:hypothetical protein